MLSLLLACATPSPEGAASAPGPGSEPAHAASLTESDLTRALYALGPQAAAARTLLWLNALAFTPDQREAFCAHSAEIHSLWRALESHDVGAAQHAELATALQALERELVAGPLSPEVQASYAQALSPSVDPLQARADTVRASLAVANQLWPNLSTTQQGQLGSGVFLLRALDTGASSTPRVLPEPWRDGDFSTLRRSTPQPELGIDGLFTLEDGDPISALSTTDRQIVLAMVLAHPGSQSACEAMAPPPTP